MLKRKFDETTNDLKQRTKSTKVLDCNLSEDGVLQYSPITSLKNIALAKVCINLYMGQQTQDSIVSYFMKKREDVYMIQLLIADEVNDKVSKLLLPKSVVEKLKEIVPLIGRSLFQWIIDSDRVFKDVSAVDEISNVAWTTRGKIDCAQTARNILAHPHDLLSDDHNYKLACTCCLEDEIAIIAPNIVNPHYLDRVNFTDHPMVYFWTAHITGDDTKLYNELYSYNYRRPEMSINLFMIHSLFNARDEMIFNEVSIRYMWNKLTELERTECMKVLIDSRVNNYFDSRVNNDLIFSLLSHLHYEQQQAIFKEYSHYILSNMLDDWLWGNYFLPTALHVIDIMKPKSFVKIMIEIAKSMKNKCIFKQLWKAASRHLKEGLSKDEEFLHWLLTRSLFWRKHMDIIQLVLNDLIVEDKNQFKAQIPESYYGGKSMNKLFEKAELEMLDQVLNWCFSGDLEMINQFKVEREYFRNILAGNQ